MQGALSFTSWYSPAQIHQDMTQLMGVLTQHPEKLGRWANTQSVEEIIALLQTLELDPPTANVLFRSGCAQYTAQN